MPIRSASPVAETACLFTAVWNSKVFMSRVLLCPVCVQPPGRRALPSTLGHDPGGVVALLFRPRRVAEPERIQRLPEPKKHRVVGDRRKLIPPPTRVRPSV